MIAQMRRRALWVILMLLLTTFSVGAQSPVVRGVFFYSPRCGHCHEVITNHWPGIVEKFGDQLQILFVDVSIQSGSALMSRTTRTLGIDSNGVPMLIIGDEVMIGSANIPARAATVIREGLDAGGVALPNVAGLQDAFDKAFPDSTVVQALPTPPSLIERLTSDPANYLAIVVLMGLIVSFALVAYGLFKTQAFETLNQWFARPLALVFTGSAFLLVVSLILGSTQNTVALILAVLVLLFIGLAGYELLARKHLERVLPLASLGGLLVAGYLAYVETTLTEATCGIVGDCNTVQQSPYAHILGIPIGVIGIAGYIAILGVWRYQRSAPHDKRADLALFGMAAFGVLFSVYLTFLEPFVIGATCVWCLTSAVLMGLLMWLTAPAAFEALRKPKPKKHLTHRA